MRGIVLGPSASRLGIPGFVYDLGPEAAHCSELQLLNRNLWSIMSICPGSSQALGNNMQNMQPRSVSTEPGEGCAV